MRQNSLCFLVFIRGIAFRTLFKCLGLAPPGSTGLCVLCPVNPPSSMALCLPPSGASSTPDSLRLSKTTVTASGQVSSLPGYSASSLSCTSCQASRQEPSHSQTFADSPVPGESGSHQPAGSALAPLPLSDFPFFGSTFK